MATCVYIYWIFLSRNWIFSSFASIIIKFVRTWKMYEFISCFCFTVYASRLIKIKKILIKLVTKNHKLVFCIKLLPMMTLFFLSGGHSRSKILKGNLNQEKDSINLDFTHIPRIRANHNEQLFTLERIEYHHSQVVNHKAVASKFNQRNNLSIVELISFSKALPHAMKSYMINVLIPAWFDICRDDLFIIMRSIKR